MAKDVSEAAPVIDRTQGFGFHILAWFRGIRPAWFHYPLAFILIAGLSSLALVFLLPPYMGADELAHLQRANLTTFGELVGRSVDQDGAQGAGGPVDLSLIEAQQPFADIIFQPGHKADVADFDLAGAYRWDGRTRIGRFDGSAMYPPLLYLPQSAGLWLGKLLDLPVVQSIRLARLGNATACLAVGLAALLLAGRSRPLLFVVLTLPMSTALYASATNDGLLICLAALAAALLGAGALEGRPLDRARLFGAAACIALVGMTKPPYVLLALVMLAAPVESRRTRLLALAAAAGPTIAWTLWMNLADVQAPLSRPDAVIDPAGQALHLVTHPLHVFTVATTTLAENADDYGRTVIGVLGWLDTPLPEPFYLAAWIVLLVAVALSVVGGRTASSQPMRWAAAGAALLAFGAIHAALYLTWNSVGAVRVEGVAGRYFLPLLAFLSLAFDRPRRPAQGPAIATEGLGYALIGFAMVGALLVEKALMVRYYLD